MIHNFLKKEPGVLPSAAILMSGSGTNADNLLAARNLCEAPLWHPGVIVTDRPESAAARLAKEYCVPYVEHDIATFYREHGEEKVGITTESGMRIREAWTDSLRQKLAPYKIDFGVFSGFVPLTNLVSDFPCLNIHPGDLTLRDENGRRALTGLHTLPIEKAILRGESVLRSSVIIVQNISCGGKEMDEGPVLGVSTGLSLDISPEFRAALRRVAEERTGKKRSEYRNDLLAQTAGFYLERLKVCGDWVLLPQVVDDFAAGKFTFDGPILYYEGKPVKTVEYGLDRQPKRMES